MKILSLLSVVCTVFTVSLLTGSGVALSGPALAATVGGADCKYPAWQFAESACKECLASNNGPDFGRCDNDKIEFECSPVWMGGAQWQTECAERSSPCEGEFLSYSDSFCTTELVLPYAACLREYQDDHEVGPLELVFCGPIM